MLTYFGTFTVNPLSSYLGSYTEKKDYFHRQGLDHGFTLHRFDALFFKDFICRSSLLFMVILAGSQYMFALCKIVCWVAGSSQAKDYKIPDIIVS